MAKKDPIEIRENIDAQMNLAQDLVSRNPWMADLNKKYPDHFISKGLNPEHFTNFHELDERFAEIYGDIFPTFPFPVYSLYENDIENPSVLILRIDLNFTKEELMSDIERFIDRARNNYSQEHTIKYERKVPMKWLEYIEIWDIMDGYAPWIRGSEGVPLGPSMKRLKRRWTYEDIARFKYPDALSPDDLKKSIDKVKKQYRAAIKLICGKKYNANEINKKRSENDTLCDKCEIKSDCVDLCPTMLRFLKNEEIPQEHKLVNKPGMADIDQYKTTRKRAPSADDQFK